MSGAVQASFPPFRLDVTNEQLWRDDVLLSLRPKPFAVLRYLAEHPGRLITREELQHAVWPKTYVSEGLLRGYVRELREILGDNADAPRFIETVPRRGYRFLPTISTSQPVVSSQSAVASSSSSSPQQSALSPQHAAVVGRERELMQLQQRFAKAMSGERQVVFITGEPGIGKTSVADAFLLGIRDFRSPALNPSLWIGRGQCVEHYGTGEAYLPILEAVSYLCRQPGGEHIVAVLHRYAPTWLAQLPALVGDAELQALQRKVQGASRERMLREMADALVVLTAERPLVLVLEDLHWSDYSTLDLLGVIARWQEPARLFILSTHRPAEIIVSGHPLRGLMQELISHRQAEELPLSLLPEQAIVSYLATRLAVEESEESRLRPLARTLRKRTDGNPLFMVNVVDYWTNQKVLIEAAGQWQVEVALSNASGDVPDNLRSMIEQQLERLPLAEQRLLETASVVGAEFSANLVAAGLQETADQVEEWSEHLASRGQFVRPRGTESLPDRTVTGRYGFVHALYQQVLYERLAATRRVRLQRRIGEAQEATYAGRVGERAAELAVHFERGQDYPRAVHYLTQAAENATRKYASREAIDLLTTGLALLKQLPETYERNRTELFLLLNLGPALMATQGFAAPGVEQLYARALELSRQAGETPQLFAVLWGMWWIRGGRADFRAARDVAEQLLRLAEHLEDSGLLLEAHFILGNSLFWLGELARARRHLERGLALYDPQQHAAHAFQYGQDPGVGCRCFLAATLAIQGYADQAHAVSRDMVTLSQQLSHPVSQGWALHCAAWHARLLRRDADVQHYAQAEATLAHEQGFPTWEAGSAIFLAWGQITQGREREGIASMRQGLEAWRTTYVRAAQTWYLALLAEAHGRASQPEHGLACLAEALREADTSGEHFYDAEMYRLKGELLLQLQARAQSGQDETRARQKGKVGKIKS